MRRELKLTGNHIIDNGSSHNELTNWCVDNSRAAQYVHGNTQRSGRKGTSGSKSSRPAVAQNKGNSISQNDRKEGANQRDSQTTASNKFERCQINVNTCLEDK